MAQLEQPITTQEELDAIISTRLGRDREAQAKKYEGFLSPKDAEKLKGGYEEQLQQLTEKVEKATKAAGDYEKQIAERDARIKGYETSSVKMRIAHESGLPYEFAERLRGDTEDDIRKDAEQMSRFITHQAPPPLSSAGNTPASSEAAAYKALSESLFSEM
jgi:hypothetical protein